MHAIYLLLNLSLILINIQIKFIFKLYIYILNFKLTEYEYNYINSRIFYIAINAVNMIYIQITNNLKVKKYLF